jgi:hypothetical protein
MTNVLLSADNEVKVYSVPNKIAENKEHGNTQIWLENAKSIQKKN